MKKLIPLLLIFAFVRPVSAGSAVTGAVPFLRLAVGARSVAMGEAFCAAPDDATALYWNPALLASVDGNSVALMHAAYVAGTSYDAGAVSFKLRKSGFAAGIQRFSSGDMTEYDYAGADLGRFAQTDLAVTLGYGTEFTTGYMAGVAAKYIHSSIITSAHSYALDAGFATPYYADRIRFAATLSNLGDTIRYDSAEEKLPLLLRLGAACKPLPKVLLTAEASMPRAGNNYLAAGLEYKEEVEKVTMAGRLGYNTRTAADVPGFNGLSAGIGIGIARLTFDYALTFFGELGTAHRFSLSGKFGK